MLKLTLDLMSKLIFKNSNNQETRTKQIPIIKTQKLLISFGYCFLIIAYCLVIVSWSLDLEAFEVVRPGSCARFRAPVAARCVRRYRVFRGSGPLQFPQHTEQWPLGRHCGDENQHPPFHGDDDSRLKNASAGGCSLSRLRCWVVRACCTVFAPRVVLQLEHAPRRLARSIVRSGRTTRGMTWSAVVDSRVQPSSLSQQYGSSRTTRSRNTRQERW